MILPTIRSSFDRADARFIIWLLSRGSEVEREKEETRLREDGLDSILDDPRTLNAVLTGSQFSSARPELVFYVLVRHALLEDGITDRGVADYLSALLSAFGVDARITLRMTPRNTVTSSTSPPQQISRPAGVRSCCAPISASSHCG